MTFKPNSFASIAAIAAALSMTATPAVAAELPRAGATPDYVVTGDAGSQDQYRYRRHRHRDRGIDAGDVVAGVLVVGAIAAIAGAFDGDDNDRDRRDRDYRDRDYPDYRDRSNNRDRYDSSGMERAADMCVDQVERGNDRVDEITDSSRRADGWHVSGTLDNGGAWNCWIDNDGRIRNVDLSARGYSGAGGYSDSSTPAGTQWNDDAYLRARASTRTPADQGYAYASEEFEVASSDEAQPQYPGGPLPGEDGYGDDIDYNDIDGDIY